MNFLQRLLLTHININPILQTTYLSWPTNANDRWDPVTGHAMPCCCQRCLELPWKNPPPFVPEPFEEYDEEYYDEEYEEREDTPKKQLCDVRKEDKEDNEDTHINAIKLLTDNSRRLGLWS